MKVRTTSRKRILVVVRDDADRLLLAKALRRAGYGVVEAQSEAEATAALSLKPCDAMLVETGAAPEGGRVLAALRSIRDVPALAVSSELRDDEAKRAGFALRLEKPVDLRRLPWRIGSVLKLRRRVLGTGLEECWLC